MEGSPKNTIKKVYCL